VSAALGVGAGLLAVALGVGLVLEAGSGFGRAWAAVFVVFGVVSLLGVAVGRRPPERGSPWARPLALAMLLLLAGWAVITAVIGVLEESWLWGVLLGVPAAYLLWFAARVWRSDPADRAIRRR
jgi:FtsH-binding integral membrane protein